MTCNREKESCKCKLCCHWLIGLQQCLVISVKPGGGGGELGHFKNIYGLLNLRAVKFLPVNKMHIFQCMAKLFCANFKGYL